MSEPPSDEWGQTVEQGFQAYHSADQVRARHRGNMSTWPPQGWRLARYLGVAATLAVLLVGTASNTIRWRLPDQPGMRSYLARSPFDSFPELSDPVVTDDGENHHLCFMCSTYGVTEAYTLAVISTEPAQRAFCDKVAAALAIWQGGEGRIEPDGYRAGTQDCVFTVSRVRNHDDWRMTIVVAFLPEVHYTVNDPPQVIVGLDDYS